MRLILIAQDTTDYGYDLGLKNGLASSTEKNGCRGSSNSIGFVSCMPILAMLLTN